MSVKESNSGIFEYEETMLENVLKQLNNDNIDFDDLKENYSKLISEYAALLNQAKKMTRISDNSQRKLIKAQEILQDNSVKINAQNEQLVMLNATKDKFFSIISHDLRNPITSVMLLAEILSQQVHALPPEKVQEQFKKIVSSIKNVYELFDNLLRWSKTQTGTINFDTEEINLLLSAQSVAKVVNFHAEGKKIELLLDIPTDVFIWADSNMLETILRNLVSNSIKFTNEGGFVKISYKLEEDSHHIIISDNGIGMNQDTISKLFKIGENVKRTGTAKEAGSGLGLILCKEFIDKHDGKIWVESQIGVGSEFHIELPL